MSWASGLGRLCGLEEVSHLLCIPSFRSIIKTAHCGCQTQTLPEGPEEQLPRCPSGVAQKDSQAQAWPAHIPGVSLCARALAMQVATPAASSLSRKVLYPSRFALHLQASRVSLPCLQEAGMSQHLQASCQRMEAGSPEAMLSTYFPPGQPFTHTGAHSLPLMLAFSHSAAALRQRLTPKQENVCALSPSWFDFVSTTVLLE